MALSLSIAALLVTLLGLAWTLMPGRMLSFWKVSTDAIGLFVARHFGLALLGFGLILALLERDPRSPSALRAVLVGSAFTAGSVAILKLLGLRRGLLHAGAWISVVVESLLALVFLGLLARS